MVQKAVSTVISQHESRLRRTMHATNRSQHTYVASYLLGHETEKRCTMKSPRLIAEA